MRFSSLLFAGLGRAVAVQFSNTTSKAVEPTPSQIPIVKSLDGLPVRVGDFELYGCANSSAGFPTLTRIAVSEHMSLDLCAASCPLLYFGVHNTDCYCGDKLESTSTHRVADTMCNSPCPGKKTMYCGGYASGGFSSTRRSPAILLSTYRRAEEIPPRPSDTLIVTVTRTTGTSPTCSPDDNECAMGGDSTEVVGMVTEICPAQWHSKSIICYGDYCASAMPCGVCSVHYRVVCEETVCRPVVCEKEVANQLVICTGDVCTISKCVGEECQRKVVCYEETCVVEKCIGEECQKKLVCEDDECKHEECTGDDCFTKVVCVGDECVVDEGCVGECVVTVEVVKPEVEQPVSHNNITGKKGVEVPMVGGSSRTVLAALSLALGLSGVLLLAL